MCGIAGFIDYNKSSSLDILKKATSTLQHRGPDGDGFEFIEEEKFQLGLGHRRLSIIDLSNAASQPMWYKHLCIIFNGEVYNYAEIKDELIAKGHSFANHSDTEMILHAWEEWGPAMIQRFIGMFVFVIYDAKENSIQVYRDRAGVKPFIYYWKNDLFLFGSEMKALMAHPAFPKKINIDAVGAYMQFGYVPTPHSIFHDTFKLKPGHWLKLDLSTKTLTTHEYWSVYHAYNQPKLNISLPDAIVETEKLLENAFQYRMVSDVPVGVFLSGGYDSSCVTALLQKNNTEKIKTFTIGVPDAGLNEAPHAKEIANFLGTDHTEYYCTHKEALEIIPQLPEFYDEPFADSSAIPTTLVCKIAREKVTVALSADAGDEIFAGYNRYEHVMKYGNSIRKLPGFIRKAGGALMDKIPATAIPFLNKNSLFPVRYEKVKAFLKNPSEENILTSITKQLTDADVKQLLKSDVKQLRTAFESKELAPEHYSTLSYMMAIDYQTYMLDDILQKVDRAGMSVSLEGREPFLDQRIIEWAARLPNEYKYNNGNKKFILKEIVHRHIPKEMMDRPKMGFGIPMGQWLSSDLKHFVDEFLDGAYIEQQGIFENETIQALRNSFYNGKLERAEKLWYVLSFQLWYNRWMKNN
ncbi:MAG: asparagine synthase (glutamine-hydrolyzing) [Chitinophagaceae bacterium]|nr:MAG: asparagine synthase (glutamine-hydrolyzing) [Chitinophagaceae bacterium]